MLRYAVTEADAGNRSLLREIIARNKKKGHRERETSRKRNTEAEEVLLVFCVKSKELCVGTVKKGKVRGKRKNEKTLPLPPPLETVVSRPDR